LQNYYFDQFRLSYIINMIAERYIIEAVLGQGGFGQVRRAVDTYTNTPVALKICPLRHVHQAQHEALLLQFANKHDVDDKHHIVRLLHFGEYKNDCFIVMELLSQSLFDVLQSADFIGLPMETMRTISKQLIEALMFLERLQIIHGDLKPENILLCDPDRMQIKLIDFGLGNFADGNLSSLVQSRYYRAPEVLFNLQYDISIDWWSLGCIMYELHTGKVLFEGTDDNDQALCITALLGLPPIEFMLRGRNSLGNPQSVFIEQENGSYKPYKSATMTKSWTTLSTDDNFCNVLRRVLTWNKNLRDAPDVLKSHVFFQE